MKNKIVERTINELRLAQTNPWTRSRSGSFRELSLPPALPLPDGQQLHATDELLDAVSKYAQIFLENDLELKIRIKRSEFVRVVQEAFGAALAEVDLDIPTEQIIAQVRKIIDRDINDRLEKNGERLEVVLGCEVLRTSVTYPIEIGPVKFQTKKQWCERALSNGEISDTCARRLMKYWNGATLKKRKASHDSMKEESIKDAIGASSTVCTVMCDGLSWKMINEKSPLAARLAMTALSLLWRRPSEALKWMNLLYDGDVYHKHYVLFGLGGRHGSSSSVSLMSGGINADDKFPERINEYVGTLGILGEVLHSYVQPKHDVSRPAILNALFLSLWWFHEGCRERSDQIATTKFAASMDALTGGRKMNGIVKLIEARIGPRADEKFMNDGRTTIKVIRDLYNDGRSRLIHGSSDDYAHDWMDTRITAEVVARLCLVEVSSWLSENPEILTIEQVSEQ